MRNGTSVLHKVELLQENVQIYEMFDLDIAMLQTSASLMHTPDQDYFVASMIHQFGVSHFFDWNENDSKELLEFEWMRYY